MPLHRYLYTCACTCVCALEIQVMTDPRIYRIPEPHEEVMCYNCGKIQEHLGVCCSVMQCAAVRCCVLQYAAVCCSVCHNNGKA